MSHQDIEGMIAETLDGYAEPREASGGRVPAEHEHHILEQYVALCRTAEPPEREHSAVVALPIARQRGATAPAPANPFSSMVKRVLARVKR